MIMQVPVFIDEAIHIDCAKAAMNGYIVAGGSLGKWLAIQTYGLNMRLFGDTLYCARLVPVILGLINVIVLFVICQTITNRERPIAAWIAALLYIAVPFSLFFDRLALTDQFLSTFLALIILFTFRVTGNPTCVNRLFLGAAICLAPLFKYNGLLFWPIPIIMTLITARRREMRAQLRRLALSYGLATPLLITYVLLASPVAETDRLTSELSARALLQLTIVNGRDIFLVLVSVLTPLVSVGLASGCLLCFLSSRDADSKRRILVWLVVAVYLVIPYILFFRVWYDRYLLPMLVPLCLLAGELASSGSRGTTGPIWKPPFPVHRIILLSILLSASGASFRMILHPTTYPQNEHLRTQYITGWSSGYGLQEAIGAISSLSSQDPGQCIVLRSPLPDLPLQGLDLFQGELGPNVKLVTFPSWHPRAIRTSVTELLTNSTATYLLFNSAYPYANDRDIVTEISTCCSFREIAHYVKPDGKPGLRLWQLFSHNDHSSQTPIKHL